MLKLKESLKFQAANKLKSIEIDVNLFCFIYFLKRNLVQESLKLKLDFYELLIKIKSLKQNFY